MEKRAEDFLAILLTFDGIYWLELDYLVFDGSLASKIHLNFNISDKKEKNAPNDENE